MCADCGQRVRPSAKFCHHCGSPNRPCEATQRGPTPQTGVPWRDCRPVWTDRGREPSSHTVGFALGVVVAALVVMWALNIGILALSSLLGLSAVLPYLVGATVGQYVGFGGLSLWYFSRRGFDLSTAMDYLGVRRPTVREFGWLVAGLLTIALLLGIVFAALQATFPQFDVADPRTTAAIPDSPVLVSGLIAVMTLTVGPCEELLFRGVVQARFREHMARFPAVSLATAVFTLAHLLIFAAGPLADFLAGLLVVVVAGAVFGTVYEYTHNLVLVALLHGVNNSMLVVLYTVLG